LPIPGSPARRNRRPLPARAASSPSARAPSSGSRPTNTGAPARPEGVASSPGLRGSRDMTSRLGRSVPNRAARRGRSRSAG
jgi:hypothetical protein